MNYLITGVAGFIGHHLAKHLSPINNKIYGIDNLSSINSNVKLIPSYVEFFRGDVCNINNLKKPLPKIDVIFHISALPRIQPSFEEPEKYLRNNIDSTIEVLEYARLNDCKVIYAGSSTRNFDVYANPYAFSKYSSEEGCKLYNTLYNIKGAILRFHNVYGSNSCKDEKYGTLIGICEYKKENNLPITIYGDGTRRRDFTAVEDICEGLILASKRDLNMEEFNLGSGKNYSINEIVDAFGLEKIYAESRKGEAQETLADIESARKLLGYEPKHDVMDYIEEFCNNLEI